MRLELLDQHVRDWKKLKRQEYFKEWKSKNYTRWVKMNHEYYLRTKDKQKAWQAEYRKTPRYLEWRSLNHEKNKEQRKNYNKKYGQTMKTQAYLMIQSSISCVRCGCTDERFLEINHKIGVGKNRGYYDKGGRSIYRHIITGRRKTDDLELLCRPCNHIHFLELKYKEKIPLRVVWSPNGL